MKARFANRAEKVVLLQQSLAIRVKRLVQMEAAGFTLTKSRLVIAQLALGLRFVNQTVGNGVDHWGAMPHFIGKIAALTLQADLLIRVDMSTI